MDVDPVFRPVQALCPLPGVRASADGLVPVSGPENGPQDHPGRLPTAGGGMDDRGPAFAYIRAPAVRPEGTPPHQGQARA